VAPDSTTGVAFGTRNGAEAMANIINAMPACSRMHCWEWGTSSLRTAKVRWFPLVASSGLRVVGEGAQG
jgi:hypothetical protein